MSTGIYSIGVSGIAAAQLNLLATEHNVVNASTPGSGDQYRRKHWCRINWARRSCPDYRAHVRPLFDRAAEFSSDKCE